MTAPLPPDPADMDVGLDRAIAAALAAERAAVTRPVLALAEELEDGARERVDLFGPGPRPTVHSDQSWSEHLERQGEPVVADTTAGEAAELPHVAAVRLRPHYPPCDFPDHACSCGAAEDRRRISEHLAARSGGAQDDGLRARVEALIEEARFNRLRGPRGFVLADDLRRALAGPDDARQDGAR